MMDALQGLSLFPFFLFVGTYPFSTQTESSRRFEAGKPCNLSVEMADSTYLITREVISVKKTA